MKTTWDLSLLYKEEQLWQKEFEKVKEQVHSLNSLSFDSAHSAGLALDEYFKTYQMIEKVYMYPRRRLDINRDDEVASTLFRQAESLYGHLTTILNQFRWQILGNEQLWEKVKKEPTCEHHLLYLQKEEEKLHHLPESNEMSIYNQFDFLTLQLRQIYFAATEKDLPTPTIKIGEKKVTLKPSAYLKIMTHEKEAVRRKAYTAYMSRYKKINATLASLLDSIYEAHNTKSILKKYGGMLECRMAEEKLPTNFVHQLILRVKEYLPLQYKWQKEKKITKSYDTALKKYPNPTETLSFAQALKIISKAMAPLGIHFKEFLKEAQNGWIDVYPNDKKRKQAFTSLSYQGPAYILLNYNNSYKDLKTLAHELGHAYHALLARSNTIEYFDFPFFLAEIASKTNEILLLEYQLKTAKNREEKKAILEEGIENILNSIFGQCMLSEFEMNLVMEKEQNKPLTSEKLNDFYKKLYEEYNPLIKKDDLISYNWERIAHYFCNPPFYIFTYITGECLAITIANNIIEDSHFLAKYEEFLRFGGTKKTEEALEFLGIKLSDTKYIETAMTYLEKKIKEIKK